MSSSDSPQASGVPAISVVIPAYNAERTLAATLESVLSQSHKDFEVIVVDDGSTDDTSEIARLFAARDQRLRIISREENSGLADARNTGIRSARAALISPIDADDVWHETYLEKMHGALTAAGANTLFAFANFRNIDMSGEVLGSAPHYPVSGCVFNRFMIKNFVGNGSGLMFRRDAALAVGGYERRLQHEFGSQGCEDWLLQMRLAVRGDAVGVCEYLVGYREVPGAMSSDHVRMWRSRIHAFEILFDETGCEDTLAARWGLGRANAHCMIRELLAGKFFAGFRSLREALARDLAGTLDVLVEGVTRTLKWGLRLPFWWRRQRTKGPFASCDPLDQRKPLADGLLARRLSHMAELDRNGRDSSEPTGRPFGRIALQHRAPPRSRRTKISRSDDASTAAPVE